jgi:hypothetical protein
LAKPPAGKARVDPNNPGCFAIYDPDVFLCDFFAIICMMDGDAARKRAVALPCNDSALPKRFPIW